MSQRLPVYINPEHACTRGLMISGTLKLEKMERLKDRLIAPFGEIDLKLEFTKEGRHNRLSGSIKGEVVVQCQRCMQAMRFSVDHEFKLAFIHSDAQVESLLPGDEPCLISDQDIILADIIEEELELYLPMIVMHDDENCIANFSEKSISEDTRKTSDKKQNPFAVLADLKKK